MVVVDTPEVDIPEVAGILSGADMREGPDTTAAGRLAGAVDMEVATPVDARPSSPTRIRELDMGITAVRVSVPVTSILATVIRRHPLSRWTTLNRLLRRI